ncbi:mitochondrial ribosomal protein subunit L20-domain-containing protein [Pilobolus umbonatus]|nr:mitochondrial ribosomal protein subunit L20-domain-containing protein [Pilobolus umbonatus]
MNRSILTSIRTYATKSKTTNLKWKPSVPVEQSTLPDGAIFISRKPVVAPEVQAVAAPPIHKPIITKTLTEAEIQEMRQLRNSDPVKWTRSRLAEKFGCSQLFVGISAPLKEAPVVEEPIYQGYRRQLITKQRQKRKELW